MLKEYRADHRATNKAAKELDQSSVDGLFSIDVPQQPKAELGLFEMMEQGKLDDIDAEMKTDHTEDTFDFTKR